jgi:hypothetical protein
MVSVVRTPQAGQVKVDRKVTEAFIIAMSST